MSAEETDKVSNFIDEISGLQKVAFARARFDYTNLVSLFKTYFNYQELQEAFEEYGNEHGKPKPLLSAAVSPARSKADIAYDKPAICR